MCILYLHTSYVCMYVCIYVHIIQYIFIMHAPTCTYNYYTNIRRHILKHNTCHTQAHTHQYVHKYVYVPWQCDVTLSHLYACTYVRTCKHDTDTHTPMYICIYTQCCCKSPVAAIDGCETEESREGTYVHECGFTPILCTCTHSVYLRILCEHTYVST